RRIVDETRITAIYVTHDQKESLSLADRMVVLRDGRIEQAGGPRELYERPDNRFVAEFLGETNFLDATVEGAPGASAGTGASTRTVKTAAGVLESTTAGTHLVGTTLTASIRPEAFHLHAEADAPAGRPALRGVVAESTYLGEMAQHRVDCHPRRARGADGGRGAGGAARGVSDGQRCSCTTVTPSARAARINAASSVASAHPRRIASSRYEASYIVSAWVTARSWMTTIESAFVGSTFQSIPTTPMIISRPINAGMRPRRTPERIALANSRRKQDGTNASAPATRSSRSATEPASSSKQHAATTDASITAAVITVSLRR
ncbi:MAG: TOBE domain-containing protein, partial [Proteobacteria bacterium]|nr:TOBE domain-containing protein [Pseudomonadota bacterium]